MRHIISILGAGTLLVSCTQKPATEAGSGNTSQEGGLDRTVLPIPEPLRPAYTELDARNATAPPRFEVKAPKGAPNVVVVLIDDMGFGVSEAFGGPVTTPTMNMLAQNGLKYNRFHTTALSSPTRVALLTGYNHHSNNMGCIGEAATTFPGNTSVRPQSITPMAEVLRQNGYNTAAIGVID
jgi:arylsulfatase